MILKNFIELMRLCLGLKRRFLNAVLPWSKSRIFIYSGILSLCLLFAGCYLNSQRNEKNKTQNITVSLSDDTVIYEAEGYVITAGEVNPLIRAQLKSIEMQIYNTYKTKALELIEDKTKLDSNPTISDKDLDNYLKSNKLPLDQRAIAKQLMLDQKIKVEKGLVIKSLIASNKLKYVFNERAEKDIESSYFIARNETSGTPIYLFCDFTDPICKELNTIVMKFLATKSKKFSIYFSPVFNSSRTNSYAAAVLATCQEKNSKFWDLVNDLYAMQSLNFASLVSKITEKYKIVNNDVYCSTHPEVISRLKQRSNYSQILGTNQTFSGYINSKRINSLDELQEILFLN